MLELIRDIFKGIGKDINLMEVCGTHTVSIFKYGIRSILPDGLRLLSGPGCPVCVTSIKDIDKAIAISFSDNVILCTFGDMMRVPGSKMSLSEAKAEGADIRVIYSPLDCINIAKENINKKIVFFSAGFETTTPLVAVTLFEAERQKIDNFYIYSVNKLVPPALDVLLQSDDAMIDGFILPGHVSAIIGINPYKFIAEKYNKPAVITGFSADDILSGIIMLLKQIVDGRVQIEIQYRAVVKEDGNQKALEFINEFFESKDSFWRGIGLLPKSGLKLKERYKHRDAEFIFNIVVPDVDEPKGCHCGMVLKGIKIPNECPLFGKRCTPERPVGACMVSAEGACAAYYKYNLVSKD